MTDTDTETMQRSFPDLVAEAQRVAISIAQQQRTGESLEAQFQAFHAAHPEVYATLCRLARRLVHRGHKHLGIGMLWETMRYRTMLGARPDEDAFRLNNNHRSRYARLIMEQESDLATIFETRSLRSETT